MSLRLIVSILGCALAACDMFGRVGETEQELAARYGTITSRQPARKFLAGKTHIYGERLVFRYEDWTVSALVAGGRCEEITYTKEGKWTDPYFNRLLEINGGRVLWAEQKTRNPANRRDWLRQDKTTASWGLNSFMVRTPAMERILADLEKAS